MIPEPPATATEPSRRGANHVENVDHVDRVDPQPTPFDVVIPSIGRESLKVLLSGLSAGAAQRRADRLRVVVVDDRPGVAPSLLAGSDPQSRPGLDLRVVRGRACGPAAARNSGWRTCDAPWIVFLDDDVEVDPDWIGRLCEDLARAEEDVAAVQGRIEVPLGHHVGPDERELPTAQLARAHWITADMAVRRSALESVGGFDERFPRAYREDTDLALRLMDRGWRLQAGDRVSRHPVQPAVWWACLGRQRGNCDDALMRRLHGRDWRARGQAPPGLLADHIATTALAAAATFASLRGRRRTAAVLWSMWCWRWLRFLWIRSTPGRDGALDTTQLAVTSAAIPPLATWWRLVGIVRARRVAPASPRRRRRTRRAGTGRAARRDR